MKRNHRWRVYTYHGGQRVRDIGLLEQYDVVITTYNIVSSEWVDEEKEATEEEKAAEEAMAMYGAMAPKKKKEEEEKDHFPEDNPNSEAALSSPLFAMHWHRISTTSVTLHRAPLSHTRHVVNQFSYWCLLYIVDVRSSGRGPQHT